MASGSTSPRVSVLLATHNRATTLPAAIASVLDQDFPSLELCIVDDASTDQTPEVLAGWSDDPRVRLLRNERNLKLPASLNRAAEVAQGAFFARIDDDDRWTDPHKLSAQLAWMERHADGVLVGTGYVDEWGRPTRNPGQDEEIRRQMLLRCPFCHPSVLMRRTAFEAVEGYDETLPYGEDWELWMRLGTQGRLGNLDAITLVKDRGEGTLSERFFDQQLHLASDFVNRHGSAYPNARRARFMHGFSRLFFRWFPVGGRVHTTVSSAYRRVFGMGERNG